MWSDYYNKYYLIPTILYFGVLMLFFKYINDRLGRERRFVRFASTLPGPYALPIFGNSFNILFTGKKGPTALLREYFQRYGPTYRIWIGKYLQVALSDPADLEVVFHSSKMLGKNKTFQDAFNKFWGDGLATVKSVNQWKVDRKRLQPFFAKHIMKSTIPVMNAAIYKFIQRIKTHVNGFEFDIGKYFEHLSYDIITRIIFDYEAPLEEKSLTDLITGTEKALVFSSIQMFLPMLNNKLIDRIFNNTVLNSIKNNLQNHTKRIIAKSISSLEKDGLLCEDGKNLDTSKKLVVLDSYRIRQETDDEKKMIEELLLLQAGGIQMTSTAMSFTLLMIAMYPDIQEKLYNEVYDVFGGDDRPADYNDIQRLKYMDQVIKETLRRFTLVPFISREVAEDVKIGSRVFPAGTGLMIDITNVHYNPKYYPEPFQFNPDNFSPEAVKNRPKYSFIAFSTGPRDCIGKHLGDTEMKLTLVAILRSFTIQTSIKIEEIELKAGFVVSNVTGYPVSFKWRNSKTTSI